MLRSQVKRVFDAGLWILGKRYLVKSLVVVPINLMLTILDLAAVIALGVVTSLIVSPNSTGSQRVWINKFFELLGQEDTNTRQIVVTLGIFALGILVSKSMITLFISSWISRHFSFKAAFVSTRLVSEYLEGRLNAVKSNSAQKTIFALTEGVQNLVISIYAASLVLVADIIILTVYSVGLLFVSPSLGVVIVLYFGVISIGLSRITAGKIRELGTASSEAKIGSSQRLQDLMNLFRELHARYQVKEFIEDFAMQRQHLANSVSKMNLISLNNKHIMEFAMVIGVFLMGWIQLSTNELTDALFILSVFIASIARILPAIIRLQSGFLRVRSAIYQSQPTIAMLNTVRKNGREYGSVSKTKKGDERVDSTRVFVPSVSLSQLSFRFDSNSDWILRDLNLEVAPSEFLAITGPSGIGKSSLLDLILGLLEPTSGIIEISGMNPLIAEETWPGRIAYVPQDVWLLDGTLRSNLSLSSSKFEDYKFEYLAKQYLRDVDLYTFFQEIEGLDTRIGPGGLVLSGGQKQRIGIIRALLAEPTLILLDESTSAVDATTEKRIFKMLNQYRQERKDVTLLVVSHRLSTIKSAERILYLGGKGEAAVGNFESLVMSNSAFRSQVAMSEV